MWWCCGKSSKLALGCKFSKHEVEHEEEEQLKTQHYELNDRCLCCKDLGHKIVNCPKDPNLKTKHSQDLEYNRIMNVNKNKKVFGDTYLQTAHMLKKCVV